MNRKANLGGTLSALDQSVVIGVPAILGGIGGIAVATTAATASACIVVGWVLLSSAKLIITALVADVHTFKVVWIIHAMMMEEMGGSWSADGLI